MRFDFLSAYLNFIKKKSDHVEIVTSYLEFCVILFVWQMEMLFCSTVMGMPFSIPPMVLTGELFTAWSSCSQVKMIEKMTTWQYTIPVVKLRLVPLYMQGKSLWGPCDWIMWHLTIGSSVLSCGTWGVPNIFYSLNMFLNWKNVLSYHPPTTWWYAGPVVKLQLGPAWGPCYWIMWHFTIWSIVLPCGMLGVPNIFSSTNMFLSTFRCSSSIFMCTACWSLKPWQPLSAKSPSFPSLPYLEPPTPLWYFHITRFY